MFRRQDRTTATLHAPLPAFALALALLCPPPLAAADMLQETLKAKAQAEQEQQRFVTQGGMAVDKSEADESGTGGKRPANPRPSKSFPGPVLQPGTQPAGQTGGQATGQATGQASGQQPAGSAAPKSGKAMYGDIVIHK